MMQKTIFFYFLCVIFLFNSSIIYASFPIEKKIYNDTTSQPKKETVEEYKIRMQKQLYGYGGETQNTNQKLDIHRGIFILFLITAVVGVMISFYGIILSSWQGFDYFILGVATLFVSSIAMLLNFLIKIIRKKLKKE